jgi:hypothetical protein
MKGYADEMAAVGNPLEDEDFVSYLLAGLDQDYNSFVENVVRKIEITLGSLYLQFLAVEARLELQNSQSQSMINAAVHGCSGGYCGRGGGRGDGGGRGGFGRGFGGRGGAGSWARNQSVSYVRRLGTQCNGAEKSLIVTSLEKRRL